MAIAEGNRDISLCCEKTPMQSAKCNT